MQTELNFETVKPVPDGPDLGAFDWIVINTSAGKDSQAMMDHVVTLARQAGVADRLLAVHADLGRVEWSGTRELAEEHAAHYGIPIRVVHRDKGDLLQQVEERGMWPDARNRYCTSDQKRGQVAKVYTSLAAPNGRRVRILNCLGFRKEESPARAKRQPLAVNERASNGKREVVDWLPIHTWATGQVWARIKASGVRWHRAYDLGMPRLSCCFCIFAPFDALAIAGQHNPELLAEYCRVEEKIGHTFRNGFKIAKVRDALAAGYQPKAVQSWTM